ncbi:MAG: DUF91 domain-containing protein [Deltaproteobacteria bacterium]|nr:DUF91 domain-containing protein [Deltaproteobacteria bacterium]
MNQEIQYNRNFSLFTAYQFLEDHGLKKEADDIKNSPDKFKSYTSTLRRAKVVVLIKSKNFIDQFLEEVWPSGKTKKGLSRTRFFENLYQRFLDSEEGITQDDEENEDDIPIEESQFAYETDLRDYLASNLHIIENGLRLYVSESGERGVEYIIPKTQRRIDILAIDKNNDFVVIELKVSRGYEKTIGQALYYQSMVKNTFDVEKVRIILIAREISEELRMGIKYLPDVQLFEYQLSLTLNQI